MSEKAEVAETLSKREKEVASAYADGASYKEIARDLGISPTTVRSHLRTVYSKLKVTSKIALAQALVDPTSGDERGGDENLAADLALELDEAIRRERAMSRVLRIISESDASIEDVIDEVVDHALEICDAEFGILMEHHGDFRFSEMWSRNISPAFAKWLSEQKMFNPGPETAVGRAAQSLQPVSIADVGGEGISWDENPLRMATVEYGRARSLAAIPMTAGGRLIGVFSVYRTRVHPFNDRALELAQAFADQAAIAIENARQIAGMEARLDQAAATREILDAINSASDDEGPVFDAILRNARRLCDAPFAALILGRESEGHQSMIAHHGAVQSTEDIYNEGRVPMDPEKSFAAKAIIEKRPIHLPNMKDTDQYRAGVANVVELCDLQGIRTNLFVPLIKDGEGIGCFIIFRHEVRPYSDEQIALVETFAAQAVIALENVRQFRELRERLDREATTRQILGLLSKVREDEQPVFEAILDNATRLCGAPNASLILGREGDAAQIMVASRGGTTDDSRALYNSGAVPMDPTDSLVARAIIEQRAIHVPDMAETDGYKAGHPRYRMLVEEQGIRTNLFVPLIGSEGGVGCFILWKDEVKPFSPDEIALVETFAAQATIAIENVRQFREVQERLEREAASRDILDVISQSRDDEAPVFDVILENAAHLCVAPMAGLVLLNDTGDTLVIEGVWGDDENRLKKGESGFAVDSDVFPARAFRAADTLHIPDIRQMPEYIAGDPRYVALVEERGFQSYLCVPLFRDGAPVGCIDLFRTEPVAFSDRQIALVKTFATQAVIAIENVRQFREVQTRLERERASAEILEVISQSRDDEKPVFNAILERTAHLCQTDLATFNLMNEEGTHLEYAAHYGSSLHTNEVGVDRWSLESTLQIAESVREGRIVHNVDLRETQLYINGDKWRRQLADDEGVRSSLTVPLNAADGKPIGCIGIYRKEVRAFTDDEIAMVETFAAQAVIAIENVRQFKALETLNAELGDRVQDQVGEIERMGRLKRFLPSAVANAVVTSGDESMLTSHRALVATLFCDMRGFTAFCESAEPEETIEVLQTYHQEMSELIDEYGGGVDQRAGDGIMVIFNDPIPVDDPAGDAVRLAVAMRKKMKELCAGWKRLGYRLGFGVGVSLGYATVGMVGSAGRFDYTASGTSVNMAARLCDMAKDGEVLIAPRVWIAVEGEVEAESRGEVEMKGIREPVEVFAVA